uniref:THAP-type domain-containing protein n=1 Tax=Haemonchus contortus TaxID=6289 RepID=A0A7I5EAI5_HAECO
MMKDLAPELSRRKPAAWVSFKNVEGLVKNTKSIRLCARHFDSAALPTLKYTSETWTLRVQDKRAVNVVQCAVERTMLETSLHPRMQRGIRSSELGQRTPLLTPRERSKIG